MVRKILSPTDLSHNSKAGVAYALSLAHENHAEMILLYITAIPFHQFEAFCEVDCFTPTAIPQLTISYYLREAKMQLGHFLYGHFAEAIKGVQCSLSVSFGNVSTEIVRAAAQEEADLIVMAKRKRRSPFGVISRSVSEAVSRHAPCPVLTVCPPQILRPQFAGRAPLFGGILQRSEVF